MNENVENNKMPQVATLPKNVRQIGEVDSGMRIYIEDYVYTYIHQLATKHKQEQIAFLVGSITNYEKDKVMLVCGAIVGEYINRLDGKIEISNETWSHAYDQIKRYFSDYEIIGWVHTQPEYGVLLSSNLVQQHKTHFKKDEQVLMILDPVEKEESFFQLQNGELRQRSGFFIYYEKNPFMHEYMLDHKVVEEHANEPKFEKVMRSYRIKDKERKEEQYHKKFVSMLSAVCGGLLIVCIIIGVGLINNMEEMSAMKESFQMVIEDYSQLKQDYSNSQTQEVSSTNQQEEPININNTDLVDTSEEQSSNNSTLLVEKDIGDQENSTIDDEDVLDTQEQNSSSEETQEVSNIEVQGVNSLPETYIIQPGDNLIKISYRFFHTKDMVSQIQELNNIQNPHKIYVGQKISLPQPQ